MNPVFQLAEKEEGEVIRDDVPDDQAVIFHVKGKGIVVLLGCGHSGVINTLNYAKELSGCGDIYMVLGGFHLCGKIFEKYTDKTIDELLLINSNMLVPTHCTGFNSTRKFAERMPASFVLIRWARYTEYSHDQKVESSMEIRRRFDDENLLRGTTLFRS